MRRNRRDNCGNSVYYEYFSLQVILVASNFERVGLVVADLEIDCLNTRVYGNKNPRSTDAGQVTAAARPLMLLIHLCPRHKTHQRSGLPTGAPGIL